MTNRIQRKRFSPYLSLIVIGTLGAAVTANPLLTPGTWVNINPSGGGLSFGANANLTQGMAIDPTNPNVLYVCICAVGASASYPKGIYKSTDAGSTWTNMHSFDSPNHVRVDPKNSQHLYLTDGVAGGTHGFYVSTDGGATWTKPQGFLTAVADPTVNTDDVYQVVADPTDFNHVLISFHSAWPDRAGYTYVCGVLESTDGGNNWMIRYPAAGMNSPGFGILFLYNPALGLGNRNTWLLGCQGQGGYWRTTDAGTSWTKVTGVSMEHGGAQLYYSKSGAVYCSGNPNIIRSADNGATWTPVGPSGAYLSMTGDGSTLYSGGHGGGNFITAKESNPTSWSNFNSQTFLEGPFEMAFDSVNGIMYSANITGGVWALKLPATGTFTGASAKSTGLKNVSAVTKLKLSENRVVIAGGTSSDGAPVGPYDIKGRSVRNVRFGGRQE